MPVLSAASRARRSTANVIHRATAVKIDLFIAGSALDARQLDRRRLIRIGEDSSRQWFVHSPEDILLQKLNWYRKGGETSDRQWRDILAIIIVQGSRLDEAYVSSVAREIGVHDLLERARRDADS